MQFQLKVCKNSIYLSCTEKCTNMQISFKGFESLQVNGYSPYWNILNHPAFCV